METNSEGERDNNHNNNNNNNNNGKGGAGKAAAATSNEGSSSKPKRQMKTPFQLETLEKAYALETYPSEAMRAELSDKLGLSDRQLQMWFCHRRLKDKKEAPAKKARKAGTALAPESPREEMRLALVGGHEPGSDYGSGSGSGSSPFAESRKVGMGMGMDDAPMMRRYYESSPQSVMELRAIACVEAQLGESLREDGPVLGMEFDPLPPGAFGTPIAPMVEQHKQSAHAYEDKLYERPDGKSSKASARSLRDFQFLQDQSAMRSDAYGQVARSPYHDSPVRGRDSPYLHGDEPLPRVHATQGQTLHNRHLSHQDKKGPIFTSPHRDDDHLLHRDSFTNNRLAPQSIGHPILGPENPDVFPEALALHNDTELRLDRKRKSDEARIVREVEAHENRLRKELEKQDILRRKSEDRMRKEMERHDRERRKEEERLMRERQREEERLLREQKRELERREKFLQKEYIRAEKRRQKEELRKEKEAEKRKAAMEKATARKIAKESLDLIEDEQLELMELAAVSKGLSSIVHLDYDTLQNLDLYRDSLRTFPPDCVPLRKPFATQPWMESEENVGNLLMVWRFFITFADVLGLWPFTLNEFVQAFHDFDSRLLGELHVALLKLIIKDIEDVARTPSTGLGTNQYCSANPEGGHLQIVQGAYMWGFDIRNWQRNLNPLTWPEILRQLALSAGLGPKLKKRSATWTKLGEHDEIKGCEDIISTLRNGSAAENAFGLMREKGLLAPRKNRHRLTPGTVKFAAFHVLSLEGSKGLTVLELADKIQKSGLRDLTTSKTPEASISVALTRDQKLFERIAPSTYCVRAAYRKDPADAEAILAAARKKIRVFQNGFLGGEDADDVERDEDSEVDVDEDPEVDDLATPLTGGQGADRSNELSNEPNDVSNEPVIGKDNISNDVSLIPQTESGKEPMSFTPNSPVDAKPPSTTEQSLPPEVVVANDVNQENVEIDESNSGESWIQGLTEGEYCHLSVEERLNALVALVGVANEGNSIRVVLEDRLEAANALKKQMWAEAQLDRSRLKEDIISKLDFSSLTGVKAETNMIGAAVEGSQSPLPPVDCKTKEASPSMEEDQKPIVDSENAQNHTCTLPTDKSLVIQDQSVNPDNFSAQALGNASKRSRSQLKAYIGHIAEEVYVYRSLPLGQDRRRNRYWQFVASASRTDPCSGRIFVELNDGKWRVIDSIEAFDSLVVSLDTRGVRESHLRIMLQKIERSFKENARRNFRSENTVCRSGTPVENEAAQADSSPNCSTGVDSPGGVVCGSSSDTTDAFSLFQIELGRNEMEKKHALKRYQEFQMWVWKACLNSSIPCAMKYGKKRCMQLLATCDLCLDSYPPEDTHCLSCHQTFNAANNNFRVLEHEIHCREDKKLQPVDFSTCVSSLPLGIRFLKALLALIEVQMTHLLLALCNGQVSVPPEALVSCWMESQRKIWGVKLGMSSSIEELLQLLTVFETVIKRDRLSSTFEMTKDLVGSSIWSGTTAYNSGDLGSVPVLPWIPKTTAAVALRLFELDSSVTYILQEKDESREEKSGKLYMKLPSRYSSPKNKEVELKELKQDEDVKEENFSEMRSRRSSSGKRARGGRDQGYSTKLQKRVPGVKPDTGRRNGREIDNLNQGLRQQGLRQQGRKATSGRGRRTVRKRRPDKVMGRNPLFGQVTQRVGPKAYGGSARNLAEEEGWGVEKDGMDVEGADDSNSMEGAESDDNVGPEGYEQGNWERRFDDGSNGWNVNAMEVSDDEGVASGDDNGIAGMGVEDSEGDMEISDGSDAAANNIENDEGSDSDASDDYSD